MRKGLESTGQEVSPSCHVFFALLCSLDLFHEVAHSFRYFVLLLPGGVGIGSQGEARFIVSQHTADGFDVHAVLQCQRCEGMSNSWNSISDFYCTIS